MQIHNLQPPIDQVFFDHDFLVLLESHLTYLRTQGNIRLATVSKHQNYKYEGDLFGLLDDLDVLKKFHHITARVNGYESSSDFKGDVEYLVIPDYAEVDMLKTVYQTKNSF